MFEEREYKVRYIIDMKGSFDHFWLELNEDIELIKTITGHITN